MNTCWDTLLPGELVELSLAGHGEVSLTVCVQDHLPAFAGVRGRVLSLSAPAKQLGLAQATCFTHPYEIVSVAA